MLEWGRRDGEVGWVRAGDTNLADMEFEFIRDYCFVSVKCADEAS